MTKVHPGAYGTRYAEAKRNMRLTPEFRCRAGLLPPIKRLRIYATSHYETSYQVTFLLGLRSPALESGRMPLIYFLRMHVVMHHSLKRCIPGDHLLPWYTNLHKHCSMSGTELASTSSGQQSMLLRLIGAKAIWLIAHVEVNQICVRLQSLMRYSFSCQDSASAEDIGMKSARRRISGHMQGVRDKVRLAMKRDEGVCSGNLNEVYHASRIPPGASGQPCSSRRLIKP